MSQHLHPSLKLNGFVLIIAKKGSKVMEKSEIYNLYSDNLVGGENAEN